MAVWSAESTETIAGTADLLDELPANSEHFATY